MSPVNHHITNQLRQLIYYNLDCNLARNALFFAGRLHAYEPRATEAAFLISLCHLRLGQYKSAHDYSRIPGTRGTHLGCSYVYAQACLALAKYAEGIAALERTKSLWTTRNNWNKHTESRRQHLPDAAAVYCLQGKLLHAFELTNKAIECYAEALKLNPFMWDAFIGLCDLGVNVRIPNIFKMTPEMMNGLSSTSSNDENAASVFDDMTSPPLSTTSTAATQPSGNDPFSISTNRVNGDFRLNNSKSALFEKLNGSTSMVTPISGISEEYEGIETPTGLVAATMPHAPRLREPSASMIEVPSIIEPPQAPARKVRAIAGLGMDFGSDIPPRMKTSSVRAKARVNADSEDTEPGPPVFSSLIGDRKRTVSGKIAEASVSNGADSAASTVMEPMAPEKRRSVRLLHQITRPNNGKFSSTTGSAAVREGRELRKVKATGTKGRSGQHTVGRIVSGNRKHGEPMDIDSKETKSHPAPSLTSIAAKSAQNEKAKELEALATLLELFTKLGSGYFALRHFRCQESVQIFNSITQCQKETPWVLAQMGRALYEQGSYVEAEKYYARIRTMAPARLEDMEVYSTVLWHLKKELDLAFLAHELIAVDRLSPEAWCAVGNSFALARDHDQALKCFRRATQLDPSFAYAFTLQGHEHVANEEYDKALSAYRNSIAADHRHYNAWYGLGKVYERQGKYEMAEQHYRTAAVINPTNAVLVCCIGMVLEKMNKPMQAVALYTRSCELAPRTSLARYHRARVLMALNKPEDALAELKTLKDIAPDEANVHFWLGRAYRRLKNKGEAIKHFTMALNLDPKSSHQIKEEMEQMNYEEDMEGMG